MRILTITFFKALADQRHGKAIDEEFLRRSDEEYRGIKAEFPSQSKDVRLTSLDEPPDEEPYSEVEVELTDYGLRRQIEPVGVLAEKRLEAISKISSTVFSEYAENVRNIIEVFGKWMRTEAVIHVIGAGRALLAASLAANRLAHGGARVYILGDKAPPPSSRFGGGIIAASASGRTPVVLEIMSFAQELNNQHGQRPIEVVGLSNPEPGSVGPFRPFPDLCTPGLFLGIRAEQSVILRGLADIEEQAINQILDALVVAAGLEIGVNFRLGHEDLVGGATGPWHRHSATGPWHRHSGT